MTETTLRLILLAPRLAAIDAQMVRLLNKPEQLAARLKQAGHVREHRLVVEALRDSEEYPATLPYR
jgi:hypothetical protein